MKLNNNFAKNKLLKPVGETIDANNANNKNKVNVIILKNASQNSMDNYLILEKPCWQWVQKSAQNYPCKTVKVLHQKSLINALKTWKNKDCIVLVLFADTQLLTKQIIETVLDYFILKKLSFLSLPRGYIIHSSVINEQMTAPDQLFPDFNQEFMRVQNEGDAQMAQQILQERIFKKHADAKIEINKNFTFISPDVIIGEKTKINCENHLGGNSKIGKGCTLHAGNSIVNSRIGNGCILSGVKLINCTVKSGTILIGNYVLFGANVPRDLQILP